MPVTNETLAILLSAVDESKLTPEQKAIVDTQREAVSKSLEKLETDKRRDVISAAIHSNSVDMLLRVKDISIPDCAEVITIKFGYDPESASFSRTDAGVKASFVGDMASEELRNIVAMADNPEAFYTASELGEWLTDDFADLVCLALAAEYDTANGIAPVLERGKQRFNAIRSQSDWPNVQSVLSEKTNDASGFMDDVDMTGEESALVTLSYNSAAILDKINETTGSEPAWSVVVDVGKKSRATGGGKRGPTALVNKVNDSYKTNRDYAERNFVGDDAPYKDNKLTELVDNFGFAANKFNLKDQLIRIEKANPDGPQLYHEAMKYAGATLRNGDTVE